MILRKGNQLDDFISKVGPSNDRGDRGENLKPASGRGLVNANRDMSPNKLSATRKPKVSPVCSPRSQQPNLNNFKKKAAFVNEPTCSNVSHQHKKAEYLIQVEDEQMYYCEFCATQAASQGFNVARVSKKSRSRKIPYIAEYSSSPRYREIQGYLKELLDVDAVMADQMMTFDPTEHYTDQKINLTHFYDELLRTLQKMKEDHLHDLEAEHAKSLQTYSLIKSDLQLYVEENQTSWDDICDNLEQIIEEVDDEGYRNAMGQYKNTLETAKIKVQEARETVQTYTSYPVEDLEEKIVWFEEGVLGLWEKAEDRTQLINTTVKVEHNQPTNNHYPQPETTVRTVHVKHKKPSHPPQSKSAFRSLFGEGQEDVIPEASPQFKQF